MQMDFEQSTDVQSQGRPASGTPNGIIETNRRTIADQSTVKVQVPGSESLDKPQAYSHLADTTPSGVTKRSAPAMPDIAQWAGIGVLVCVETGLMIISLLPGSIDQKLGWTSNGPFPNATVPIVTAIFYFAPLLTGLLARRWDVALLASSLPAWASLGVYSVASSTHNGIFAATNGSQPTYLVGTIELFAALGFIGWLARRVLFGERSVSRSQDERPAS